MKLINRCTSCLLSKSQVRTISIQHVPVIVRVQCTSQDSNSIQGLRFLSPWMPGWILICTHTPPEPYQQRHTSVSSGTAPLPPCPYCVPTNRKEERGRRVSESVALVSATVGRTGAVICLVGVVLLSSLLCVSSARVSVCAPRTTCASVVVLVFHWLYPSLCSTHYCFHPVFFFFVCCWVVSVAVLNALLCSSVVFFLCISLVASVSSCSTHYCFSSGVFLFIVH